MANASRVPTHVKAAKAAVKTDQTVSTPAAVGASFNQGEVNALRTTIVELRTALVKAGIIV